MTVPKLVVIHNALFLVVLMVVCHAEAANLYLTWDPAPSQVTGYRFYYSKIKRGYDIVVDVGNLTSYTLSDLESGQRYYFSVMAYDSLGNESTFGNEVNVTPFSSYAGPPKALVHTPLQLPADSRQATAGPWAFESRGEQRAEERQKGIRVDEESNASATAVRRPSGDSPPAVAHASTRSGASRTPALLRSASPQLVSEWIEVGHVDLDSDWKRVQLRKSFIDPIVVAGGLSTRQAQPAVLQLRHIDRAGFEMRLQPLDDRYSRPTPETVGY